MHQIQFTIPVRLGHFVTWLVEYTSHREWENRHMVYKEHVFRPNKAIPVFDGDTARCTIGGEILTQYGRNINVDRIISFDLESVNGELSVTAFTWEDDEPFYGYLADLLKAIAINWPDANDSIVDAIREYYDWDPEHYLHSTMLYAEQVKDLIAEEKFSTRNLVIRLPSQDIARIIEITLNKLGYRYETSPHTPNYTVYTNSGQRLASFSTSSSFGNLYAYHWFGDDLSDDNEWRRKETERINYEICKEIWKEQNRQETIQRGVDRYQKAAEVSRKDKLDALLSAYPTRDELEIMMKLEMDVSLDTIVGDGNMRSTIFKLIKWAEAKGRLNELILKAHNYNPGNPKLAAITQRVQP